MSLQIIKHGLADSVQDLGRFGYQTLGINPGGAMDRFAMQAANILVGNDRNEAVIEFHFPSSAILFKKETIIAITGADFTPTINGEKIPLWQPIIVHSDSVMQFHQIVMGARCYLSISEKLNIEKWLNSYSSNIKAHAGGYKGRTLLKDDVIPYREYKSYDKSTGGKEFTVLPWKADPRWEKRHGDEILVVCGNEWQRVNAESKEIFFSAPFSITMASDRMGYRLVGATLTCNECEEMVSSAVGFGTIQLLPDGQLILLMADHQTTGGYPRIAHVISAHLPRLAQMNAGENIQFKLTSLENAEDLMMQQQMHLRQLENACRFRREALRL